MAKCFNLWSQHVILLEERWLLGLWFLLSIAFENDGGDETNAIKMGFIDFKNFLMSLKDLLDRNMAYVTHHKNVLMRYLLPPVLGNHHPVRFHHDFNVQCVYIVDSITHSFGTHYVQAASYCLVACLTSQLWFFIHLLS